MEITVLIENTTIDEKLISEHGLSLLIENDNKKYLLDAGQTGVFMHNIEKMGVDASNVVCAVLSHGHYDHAGGFAQYLQHNSSVKVYAMENITHDYYSASGGNVHPIGVPEEVYPKYKSQFQLINQVTKIDDDVYLIPHTTKGLEKIGERTKLYKMEDDKYVGDDFAHEVSLVFDTPKGLIIFNSCSHAGMENIVEEVKEVFPGKKVYVFCGGLHMKGSRDGVEYCTFSDDEIYCLSEFVKSEKMHKLYTGHCTGAIGYEYLKEHLGEKIEQLSTGKSFNL